MSADEDPSILSCQMEAIVYVIFPLFEGYCLYKTYM